MGEMQKLCNVTDFTDDFNAVPSMIIIHQKMVSNVTLLLLLFYINKQSNVNRITLNHFHYIEDQNVFLSQTINYSECRLAFHALLC